MRAVVGWTASQSRCSAYVPRRRRRSSSKAQRKAAPETGQRQVSATADTHVPNPGHCRQSAADIGLASPIDRAWPIVSVPKRAMKLPMGAMGSAADPQRLPRAFGTARSLVQLRNRLSDAAAARMLVGLEPASPASRTPSAPCSPRAPAQQSAHDPFIAPRSLRRFQPPLVHAGDSCPCL